MKFLLEGLENIPLKPILIGLERFYFVLKYGTLKWFRKDLF
jgi:hypothetical protein